MLGSLWTPTGGLTYHFRAAEHAERRWSPYRAALAEWLDEWRPRSRTLLLFGPSGGYTLAPAFLTRFDLVFAFDPDPLAPLLFRRRFGRALKAAGTTLHWSHADLLSEPRALAEYLRRQPAAAVFFSSLLGQLRSVLDPAADRREEEDEAEGRTPEPIPDSMRWYGWKGALVDALRGHSFATVHDRVSGDGRANLALLAESDPARAAGILLHSGDRADLSRGLPDRDLRLAFRGPRGTSLSFHGLDGFLPEGPRRLFLWQLLPDRVHLMEAVSRG